MGKNPFGKGRQGGRWIGSELDGLCRASAQRGLPEGIARHLSSRREFKPLATVSDKWILPIAANAVFIWIAPRLNMEVEKNFGPRYRLISRIYGSNRDLGDVIGQASVTRRSENRGRHWLGLRLKKGLSAFQIGRAAPSLTRGSTSALP
jgi:hypothetical protein